MFVGSADQVVEHEAACPMMPIDCPQSSCKRLVLRKDLEEHSKTQCWRQCEQCGLDIQLALQEKHLKVMVVPWSLQISYRFPVVLLSAGLHFGKSLFEPIR